MYINIYIYIYVCIYTYTYTRERNELRQERKVNFGMSLLYILLGSDILTYFLLVFPGLTMPQNIPKKVVEGEQIIGRNSGGKHREQEAYALRGGLFWRLGSFINSCTLESHVRVFLVHTLRFCANFSLREGESSPSLSFKSSRPSADAALAASFSFPYH